MGRKNILKMVRALVLALAFGLMPTAGVHAASWGPARELYTNQSPALSATFNSITNNAAVGDERAFVRIAERNSGNTLTNSLRIEAGKQYVVSIYYHNDASSTTNVLRNAAGQPILNAAGQQQMGPGVALDVRVASSFPTELKAGETAEIYGKIMSTNTTPAAVWAGADVTAAQDMKIRFVEGSARIYNDWATNRKMLSQYLFTAGGIFIGLDELNGMILGCDEFSGQVAYVIQTTAIENNTPGPKPEPSCEETGTCEKPEPSCEETGTCEKPDPCKENPDSCKDPDPCEVDPDSCKDPDPCEVDPDSCKEPEPDPCEEDPDICETDPDSDLCKEPEPTPGPEPGPNPTPDPIPEPEPNVPSELPTTGPLEIVLAVTVVVIVVAGFMYWNKTHNAVKRATRSAKGKK